MSLCCIMKIVSVTLDILNESVIEIVNILFHNVTPTIYARHSSTQ